MPRDTASESTDLNPKSKNRYDLDDASLEPFREELAKSATQQKLMQYITSSCQRSGGIWQGSQTPVEHAQQA